jgi:twinkle protein
MEEDASTYLYKTSCPQCGSRNNLAVYSDNGEHCFGSSCGYHKHGDSGKAHKEGSLVNINSKLKEFVQGVTKALPKRGLTLDTCKKWSYTIGFSYNKETEKEEPCQVANYYNQDGELEGQKLRFENKVFSCTGKLKTFFGKNLWSTGKYLVITEGEVDAMSYSQATNHKYPVVSLPNGVQSAAKTIKQELKWLEENFEKVVLMFDNDEPGRKEAEKVAALFSPNKCLIAKLSEKDANDMLTKGKIEELVNAVFRAKAYKPEAIVPGSEVWDLVSENKQSFNAKYKYDFLNEVTCGLRLGELVTICAGSGIGKSQFCREIAYSLVKQDESIGYIALEESVRRTALGIMSIEANAPLHLSIEGTPIEKLKVIYDKTLANDKVYFYDHWGSLDSDNLLNHIRFLARSCDVKWIILDHISIVVSGITEGDERRIIDNLMTKLRSLSEELNIGILVVSHLKRPDGKGHEEGHEVSLAQLRGSAAIAQLSDIVIGLERNQQDPDNMHLTTVRILKNRYTGQTGVAGYLQYVPSTGRLKVATKEDFTSDKPKKKYVNFEENSDEY